MKSFLKNVLANIVAIIIVFIGGFFLTFLFFIGIASLGSTSERKPEVKENSVLTIDANTIIKDYASDDLLSIYVMSSRKKSVQLLDVLHAIQNAKTDPNIKGISIENDNFTAGITQLSDIRAALKDFKKSGKFVYAYGNTVSQSSYYLGSVADRFYLNPSGGIELKGLSSEVIFFKKIMDKYGVDAQVIRHGQYKSAVEPYLRNNLSEENKEQLSTLLNDIWSATSKQIATSRKIPIEQLNTIVDSLYSMIPAYTVQHKLVDELAQKSQYESSIKKRLKIKEEDDINTVPIPNYIRSYTDEDGFNDPDTIAVLYASGTIYGGEGYENGIYANSFIKTIKDLAKNENVKAVVLRVNSPGGSANASDEILYELQQLKAKKPLIVSFGDYAASGGYYIAMAGDKIFSEPSTLTGSIGVFGVLPNVKRLASNIGINSEAVATHTNSTLYTPLQGLTEGSENMMKKSVEMTYKRFVGFVVDNRKKTFEQIDKIGEGRVWSGTKAKELGLVDELGTLNDAIKYAAKKAGVGEDCSVEAYPKKVSVFDKFFSNFSAEEFSNQLLKSKLGNENYQLYQQLLHPAFKDAILMESYYKINF